MPLTKQAKRKSTRQKARQWVVKQQPGSNTPVTPPPKPVAKPPVPGSRGRQPKKPVRMWVVKQQPGSDTPVTPPPKPVAKPPVPGSRGRQPKKPVRMWVVKQQPGPDTPVPQVKPVTVPEPSIEGVGKTGPVLAVPLQAPTPTVPPEALLDSVPKQIAPVDPFAVPTPKTKRAELISSSALYRELNATLDEAALKRVYEQYYDEDGYLDDEYDDEDVDADDVYGLLGESQDTTYVQTPVSDDEFNTFKQSSPVIEAQEMWGLEAKQAAYRTEMRKYNQKIQLWRDTPQEQRGRKPVKPIPPPKDLDEAVARGDYFHVHNTNKLRPAWQVTTGRARRIVVNVKSQQAGLKVANSLNGLFSDPVVSPYLDHYKIFLTKDTDDPSVKHDKLVIYYETDPDATGDKDEIGDRIAATIDESIDDGDYNDEFAPFYSRIGRGIAWAEEPESHVADLTDSFTGTRAAIVTEVINKYGSIDEADFIDEVRETFEARFVDPDDPHRHLTGNKPRRLQIIERKAPPEPIKIAASIPLKPLPLPLPPPGVPVATGTGTGSVPPTGDKII
jgi:type III HopA1-like effector protein